ncbi:MAG: Uncharacterized protein G01um101431_585 [Parcubacteria group bacterium Gr01-1014_31]|nr:MAG: Uncharacterized protein G01um101431_585 [Parcubacteria group bacterium Gr01-1014_31]
MRRGLPRDDRWYLLQDLAIIAFSVAVAVALVKTDLLVRLLTQTRELEFVGSFIAGLFFTSVFTTAPAMVTLGEIAQVNTLFGTALLGAAGAVIGDLIIFRFFRDHFAEHLMSVLRERGSSRRVRMLFRVRSFRWLTFLAGGLIIASPLPDELGITLLGFSKMRTSWFIPLSFTFNFLGIVVIGMVARSLA